MAGLRSHLKARFKLGAKLNWLIFGERNATNDFHYHDDINTWQEQGLLDRVDAVFSRDQPQRLYVQHRLREAGDTLQSWIEQGAAIYICGSLKGMASDVHQTLVELLGVDKLNMLMASGRYRRDVY
jgi:sulfite reductase (NADPH) flavoprotein alpha-component